MSEAIKALREASISIACLVEGGYLEHFEDESVTKNHKKWVLKDQESLQNDLEHIQKQITILENFLDPFTIAEIEEINSVADSVDPSENIY